MQNWASFRSGTPLIGSSAWISLTFLALLTLLPTPVLAQGISGRVLDSESNRPVPTAMIVITDAAGRIVAQAIADGNGRFSIFVGQQGNFNVSVEMLGYETGGSSRLSFADAGILNADLVINPVPLDLDGLTVTSDADPPLTYLQKTGFYRREHGGIGDFIKPTFIQREHAMVASDFVRRVPGIVVRQGVVFTTRGAIRGAWAASFDDERGGSLGSGVTGGNGTFGPCPLKILLDGMDAGIEFDFRISRVEIQAIEVYKGFASVPAKWRNTVARGYRDTQGNPIATCGLVVVWSRLR